MSIIVERLDNAIMRGDISTPAWVVNTMRAAREHIAKLEAHATTDNSAVITALEARIALLEARLATIIKIYRTAGPCLDCDTISEAIEQAEGYGEWYWADLGMPISESAENPNENCFTKVWVPE